MTRVRLCISPPAPTRRRKTESEKRCKAASKILPQGSSCDILSHKCHIASSSLPRLQSVCLPPSPLWWGSWRSSSFVCGSVASASHFAITPGSCTWADSSSVRIVLWHNGSTTARVPEPTILGLNFGAKLHNNHSSGRVTSWLGPLKTRLPVRLIGRCCWVTLLGRGAEEFTPALCRGISLE